MVVSPQVTAIVFMPNSRRPPSGTTSTGCASRVSGTVIRSFAPERRDEPTARPAAAPGCERLPYALRHVLRSKRGTGAVDTDSRRTWREPAPTLWMSDPLGWAESAKSYNGQQDNTAGLRHSAVGRRCQSGRAGP